MKTIIDDNERGFLFKDGKFVRFLESGKYNFYGDTFVEIVEINKPVESKKCILDVLLNDANLKDQVSVVEVKDEEYALHYVNGKFTECLIHGKYAFWSIYDKHEFVMVDASSPDIKEDISQYVFAKIPSYFYKKIEVCEYQKGCLYYNNKLVRVLEPGIYYFWNTSVKVGVTLIDIRLTQMNIAGQEILTQDKVALRINFVCNYRIKDYVKVITEIDDYKEQIHVAAQLALRDYVGKYRIDEILQNKEELSKYVFEKMKQKEEELYIEVTDVGVKDIILPGEIRDIMNTVLVAEKKAQANVISRREEVASTRSLLNTAKLLDENKTLYKLKELEYIERICSNIGNINVTGSSDILTQLTNIIKK